MIRKIEHTFQLSARTGIRWGPGVSGLCERLLAAAGAAVIVALGIGAGRRAPAAVRTAKQVPAAA
jgi:hypothetical protein